MGLLSQSGYLLAVYTAIGLGVSSGTTALVDGTQPLVVGALSGPILGQRASGRQWLGLGLGLAGVLTVTWGDATAHHHVPAWAYPVPFLGMLCLVAATMVDRRACSPTPPLAAMAVHCATSAVVFTALAVATGGAKPPASGPFWVSVLWLVVLSTLGGYGLYWLLVRRQGVTQVNTLMFLMAPVAAVWGAMMFGEPLGWRTLGGLTLAVAAVAVAGRLSAPPTPDRTQEDIGLGREERGSRRRGPGPGRSSGPPRSRRALLRARPRRRAPVRSP